MVQGTHSHSRSRSGTLLGSSSRSATRVSTRVNLCVPIAAVAEPRPRVDDIYEMYFIFRYAYHVLDIEIIIVSVHRIVTYGVQHIISLVDSRVQTRQPTRRSISEVTALKIQGWRRELIDRRRRGFLLESSR